MYQFPRTLPSAGEGAVIISQQGGQALHNKNLLSNRNPVDRFPRTLPSAGEGAVIIIQQAGQALHHENLLSSSIPVYQFSRTPLSGRRCGSNHSAGRPGSSWCYAPFCSFLRSGVFRLIACTGKSDNSHGSRRLRDVKCSVPSSRPPFRFTCVSLGNLSVPFGHPYPSTGETKKEIHISLHLPYLFDMIVLR